MNLHKLSTAILAAADRVGAIPPLDESGRKDGFYVERSECRAELRRLAGEVVRSEQARLAEARAGLPKKSGGGVHIASDGRVITRETLFRKAAA